MNKKKYVKRLVPYKAKRKSKDIVIFRKAASLKLNNSFIKPLV